MLQCVQMDERMTADFVNLRVELLQALNELSAKDTHRFMQATESYYRQHINRELMSWGICEDEQMVAVGSLCLFERLPYPDNLTGREGYLLNIYTRPNYRRRGFGAAILKTMADYAKENGIGRLWLNSSIDGRPLYTRYGFKPMDDAMVLPITGMDG